MSDLLAAARRIVARHNALPQMDRGLEAECEFDLASALIEAVELVKIAPEIFSDDDRFDEAVAWNVRAAKLTGDKS